MPFQPMHRPNVKTVEELGEWIDNQLQLLAEYMEGGQETLTLYPQIAVPARYQDGTICSFTSGALVNNIIISEPGLYVYRSESGLWHKLEEIS